MIYPLLDDLNALVLEGAVSKAKHPNHPLWIYNYTHSAVFKYGNQWPKALTEARGLVLDEDGHIIARAFPKFWNLDVNNIRKEPCSITEKMDGSLILAFHFRGDIIVATRGSFLSPQAFMAMALIHDKYPTYAPAMYHTDVFELIHPNNRIVVDYGREAKLVYLASFSRGGEEWNRESVVTAGIEYVAHWYFNNIMDAVNCPKTNNREGFVVRWQDGTREKIKFEEYKRLHRAVFCTSEYTIWDSLRKTFSYDIGVCPELSMWSKDVSDKLVNQRYELCLQIEERYDIYMSTHPQTRKDFALLVNGDKHKSAMFLLYDDKMEEFDAYLWKQIEPRKDTLFRRESQYVG